MKTRLNNTLTKLPQNLAQHIEDEYTKVQTHYMLGEWDDLQVDAGRLCEVILRYLEWKTTGMFTEIDGRSKPNRNEVINSAKKMITLPPSLRLQACDTIGIVMDFRNNRNSAHLGDLDTGKIDGITVFHMVTWLVGELIRIETNLSSNQVQIILEDLAERPVPIIYRVNDTPVILSNSIEMSDKVLILLYNAGAPLEVPILFKWSQHTHVTRWKKQVLKPLSKDHMLFLEKEVVHLLPPGARRAEAVIKQAGNV